MQALDSMTMGFRQGTLIALLMIAGLSQSARAATYTVGGTTGWVLGITETFFDDWAKPLTFHVGDVLDFNYVGATHNIFEVSAADLASCNVAAPLKTYDTLGGASLTLTRAGTHYYICGIAGHCLAYMKLTIVVSAAAPAEAPGPSEMAPALSPLASTATPIGAPRRNTTTTTNTPVTTTTNSGSSSNRSSPAMIIGATLCAFALFLSK